MIMRRLIQVTALLLLGLLLVAGGTVMAAFTVGPPAPALAATAPARHPVILVVPRRGALRLMGQHWWCTREAPGSFACTPAAPR